MMFSEPGALGKTPPLATVPNAVWLATPSVLAAEKPRYAGTGMRCSTAI